MKNTTSLFFIVLAFALCGCSAATQTPAKFVEQLSSADRLIVTNRYDALGTTITGTNISSFITAIKSSKTKKWGTDMDWGNPRVCNLEFYAGTNHLADIPTEYGVFRIDGVEYYDSSKVLETFCRKVTEDRMR